MSLATIAQDISEEYLAELPPDYENKLSAIAKPDVVETLLEGMRSGLNDRDSCTAAGIDQHTYMRWVREADTHPNTAYASFVRAMKEARAAGKLSRLKKLIQHGESAPQHWTALAWSLERTDPEQFALRKDDSSVPKVVVQIGVQHSDVKVNILTTDGKG